MRIAASFIAVIAGMSIQTAAWDYVGPDSYKITYHYRVAAHPGGTFGIKLAHDDTTVWKAVTIRIPDIDVDELFNRTEAQIIYSHKDSGRKERTDSVIRVPFIAQSDGFPELSLRIATRDSIARISFGEKEAVYRASLKIDNSLPLYLDCFKSRKIKEIRRSLRSTFYPAIEKSRFENTDSLLSHLAHSNDPYEGLWRYYDRSFNHLKVPDGGRYNIATVKAGDRYEIIYLSTDDNIATRLNPLDIKGHLDDSGFEGIFNLRWLDSQGWPTDRYSSAQFEGNLLTLRFPSLDIMLRFARVKQSEN